MFNIFSVGGSLIYPKTGLDYKFIKAFVNFIKEEVKLGNKFILVTGGGKIARDYISLAKKLDLSRDKQDTLGIASTRQNALLLKLLLKEIAFSQIIEDPIEKINFKKRLAIAGGFKPGRSTDYVSVMLAKTYQADMVVNLSNIDYVYDKDPKIKGAKKIKNINWADFRAIVGDKWSPGFNSPFDPVAAKLAQKNNIKVVVLNGKKIDNIKKCLKKENFIGTTISD